MHSSVSLSSHTLTSVSPWGQTQLEARRQKGPGDTVYSQPGHGAGQRRTGNGSGGANSELTVLWAVTLIRCDDTHHTQHSVMTLITLIVILGELLRLSDLQFPPSHKMGILRPPATYSTTLHSLA